MRHYRAYTEFSQKYGFAAFAWDDGGDFRIMERQQKNWNELKDILIFTNAKSPSPTVDVYQDSIVRVRWNNRASDNDSIIIQRKLATELQYKTIARLKSGTSFYYDHNLPTNKIYCYRVLAVYNNKPADYSQPVQAFFPAWIRKVRTPYLGKPFDIPGIIEAEDFDSGGEGLTYHDSDASNIAGAYRTGEGVDIYDRLGKGYHIGSISDGEWLEYSLNVKTGGLYNLITSIAAPTGGGKFEISVDSVKTKVLTVLSTSSALNTKDHITTLQLTPGQKIMRFTILSGPVFNIDRFTFELATNIKSTEFSQKLISGIRIGINRQLHITCSANRKIDKYVLFSLGGQAITQISHPYHSEIVSCNKIKGGIYILKAFSMNKTETHKIFIP
jgi:hypothetical protein